MCFALNSVHSDHPSAGAASTESSTRRLFVPLVSDCFHPISSSMIIFSVAAGMWKSHSSQLSSEHSPAPPWSNFFAISPILRVVLSCARRLEVRSTFPLQSSRSRADFNRQAFFPGLETVHSYGIHELA
ncbi:hypothetical protein BT69DRAFT_1281548 [Atractiella rhizophila]|nr:hypothetical protein BT69DRAFT_1281548 [Atractiella rhizophila]